MTYALQQSEDRLGEIIILFGSDENTDLLKYYMKAIVDVEYEYNSVVVNKIIEVLNIDIKEIKYDDSRIMKYIEKLREEDV